MIGEFVDRIALGPGVRGKTLAGCGWTTQESNLLETTACFDAVGCARYVVIDVSCDGIFSGSNLELLVCLCEATDAAIVTSGGVSSLQDIETIRGLVDAGVEGVIVDRVPYSGCFTLPEALDMVAGAPAR